MSGEILTHKPLPQLAAPAAWQPLRFNEVAAFRRLDCQHYSACLNYCAGQAWEGFTCIFCPLADEPLEPVEEAPSTNQLLSALEEIGLAFGKRKGGAE